MYKLHFVWVNQISELIDGSAHKKKNVINKV